ncbi:MAG: pectate lyase [Paludibacteraceae bacterium]|nr:pectate lyase [Paludibacteraceae bacterium]
MKRSFLFFVLIFFLMSVKAEVPAFPGAYGGGAFVTGGRGGKVLVVNSLADDGSEGTFRWAVGQKGKRIIVFRVAGIIGLQSELKINSGHVTIAGQSAPGDGITIKNYPVVISADNVIIRFLRFRMGDETAQQDDALKGMRKRNIMIDHCSMSWSTDESGSFYDNENFTLQWSILSESLRNSTHKKGAHGYGGIWGGKRASFHHNLLAHHDSRNPRFCGSRYSNQPELEKVDFRNNVIYNWGSNSGYAGEGGEYNIVNNYYKPGPATLDGSGKHTYRIFAPNADEGANAQAQGVWGKFFVKGNVMHGRKDVSRNNLLGFHPNTDDTTIKTEDLLLQKEVNLFEFHHQCAKKAYREVLKKSGASFVRDEVDNRIVHEVKTGSFTFTGSAGGKNGIIDSQKDVGGWPVYSYDSATVPADSDMDGMPDAWENKKKLDKNNPADAASYSLNKNYTNIEVYLNGLVNHLY